MMMMMMMKIKMNECQRSKHLRVSALCVQECGDDAHLKRLYVVFRWSRALASENTANRIECNDLVCATRQLWVTIDEYSVWIRRTRRRMVLKARAKGHFKRSENGPGAFCSRHLNPGFWVRLHQKEEERERERSKEKESSGSSNRREMLLGTKQVGPRCKVTSAVYVWMMRWAESERKNGMWLGDWLVIGRADRSASRVPAGQQRNYTLALNTWDRVETTIQGPEQWICFWWRQAKTKWCNWRYRSYHVLFETIWD